MSGPNSFSGIVSHWLDQIGLEYQRAESRFAPFSSSHEAYAVILEELDELWDEIKANRRGPAEREAVQVGAMILRFLVDCPPMEKRNES